MSDNPDQKARELHQACSFFREESPDSDNLPQGSSAPKSNICPFENLSSEEIQDATHVNLIYDAVNKSTINWNVHSVGEYPSLGETPNPAALQPKLSENIDFTLELDEKKIDYIFPNVTCHAEKMDISVGRQRFQRYNLPRKFTWRPQIQFSRR